MKKYFLPKDINEGFDVNKKQLSFRREDCIFVPISDRFSNGVWKTIMSGITASCENILVKKGFYRIKATIKANKNNDYGDRVNFEIRAYDCIKKKNIGFKAFKCEELSETEYKTFSMSFKCYEDSKINLDIFSYNCSELFVKSLELENISEVELEYLDIETHFKKIDESKIEYSKDNLYYFDLDECVKDINDSRNAYDIMNLVCTLQGLVNRNQCSLFVKYTTSTFLMNEEIQVDDFWLNELRKDNGFLSDKKIVNVKNIDTLLRLFYDYYSGLVVWDEFVPATVNAASTAAGVENLLPVRFDDREHTIYSLLTQKYKFKVVVDLNEKFTGEGIIYQTFEETTGSKKNDVYIWAITKYLETGLTSKYDIAYHVDAFTWDTTQTAITYTFHHGDKDFIYKKNHIYEFLFLCNKDYNISQKSFFYDLFPYSENSGISPNDDITQRPGTDLKTLERIFELQHKFAGEELFYIHGYNMFQLKYDLSVNNIPNEKLPNVHSVANEATLGHLIGKYYASLIANACSHNNICNQSIYCQTPRIDYTSFASKPPKNYKTLLPEKKYYFSFYSGDYDNASWTHAFIPTFFNDKKRGEIPILWPIAPSVERILPNIYKYIYENLTPNDYLGCANNGVGFCSTAVLNSIPHKNGSMLDLFIKDSEKAFDRLGLDIMGMLIVDYGDKDLDVVLKKFCSMNIKRQDKVVISNYWAAVPDNNFTKLTYDFEGTTVCGMEIDMAQKNKGDGQDKENMKNYLRSFFIFGKEPDVAQAHYIRVVLSNPSVLVDSINELKDEGYAVEAIDPYTFSMFAKILDTKRIEFEKNV